MKKAHRAPRVLQAGIDFGTTHTVVALVDRGNYPVLSFEGGEFVPSLVAARRATGELRYGSSAAAAAGEEDWDVLRSLKSLLADAGPETAVVLGGREYLLGELLTGFFFNLKNEIYRRSNAGLESRDLLDVALGLPANAMGNQRFLTLEACRRAGFRVTAVLNEPSAAGFEYAHRYGRTITSRRSHVVVYDLGGGTFDTSLIEMGAEGNEVVTTSGASRLGGDDFDRAILELLLDRYGLDVPDEGKRKALLDECRRSKEMLSPTSRRFIVDLDILGLPPAAFPVAEIFAACGELVEKTMEAMEPMVSRLEGEGAVGWEEVAGIYSVGGASRFPPVYRRLRERFGTHRVHLSPHTFAATAVGLAIFLDEERESGLRENLTRNFGVWREREEGREVFFDVIFSKDTPLPGDSTPLEATRTYRAAHDIGHFRYVECSQFSEGAPAGELLPWGHIHFPFDGRLREECDLPALKPCRSTGEGPEVVESYRCSREGVITVMISIDGGRFSREYTITPAPLSRLGAP